MFVAFAPPYDFGLSVRVTHSFGPERRGPGESLRMATRVSGAPTLIEVSPVPGKVSSVSVSSTPDADRRELKRIVEWVLVAELDLRPFYRLVNRDPTLGPIARRLEGLKPMRPLSLFEMAVYAVTEQQISLAAAYHVRNRIVERFGAPFRDQWVFPEPEVLAEATTKQLLACGLSHQKARYIHELARKVSDGTFDFEALQSLSDEQARERIMELNGFGRWSADYILIRGLARSDSLPEDDLGVRRVIGEYLGSGQRLTAAGVSRKLEPFRPYRGLVAFYLLAAHRLNVARPAKWS